MKHVKKILCLLVCFLLFFCCACKKDDLGPINDEGKINNEKVELGTLYTSAGNIYNTHIRMQLVTEELTAPVKSLTVSIHNDTDYYVNLLGKVEEWECEKWESEEWIPQAVSVTREVLYTDSISPQSKRNWTISYAGDLNEGLYRLQRIVKAQAPNDWPDSNKEAFECKIDAYFTIAPAPKT